MSTYNSNYTNLQITSNISKFYNTPLSIVATAPENSYIYATLGGNRIESIKRGNIWYLYPTSIGLWTVYCSNGQNLETDTVDISALKVYEVDFTQGG